LHCQALRQAENAEIVQVDLFSGYATNQVFELLRESGGTKMFLVSRKKLLLTVVIVALALLALGAWSPWVPLRYQGDGKLSDRGFFSYPRYLVTFSDIQLSQTGEYHFHFRGLPNEEMTLMLYVKNVRVDTWADSAPLTNLQVNIEALLTDDKGHLACRAEGSPAPSNGEENWVLTFGGDAAYWHHRCNFVQVYPGRAYDLVIRVKNAGQAVKKVVATPGLRGGGLELP
jgi:hypothetical protein